MTRDGLLIALVLAACGPQAHETVPTAAPESWREEAAAHITNGSIAPYLRGPVEYAGIWFPDTDCRTQFPAPRTIAGDELADLGRCLDGLHLARDERSHALPDFQIFSYQPGLEIEARFRLDQDGTKLVWLGYVGSADRRGTPPTIKPAMLESLRSAGDPNGGATGQMDAWFKVCIDQEGSVTGVHPIAADTPATFDALTPTLRSWEFHPVVLGDQAMPACAWIEVAGPASLPNDIPGLIPMAPLDPDIHADLPKRVEGDALQVPNDKGKREVLKAGLFEMIPTFWVCADADGKVTKVVVYASSGLPALDRMYVGVIKSWRYERADAPSCDWITYILVQDVPMRGPLHEPPITPTPNPH